MTNWNSDIPELGGPDTDNDTCRLCGKEHRGLICDSIKKLEFDFDRHTLAITRKG